jgi:DNA uptake protein ComE-like DNA-binding protein
MTPFPIDQFPVRTAGLAQALLGARHGYRFEGDTIHLNAMFTVINPTAHNRAWALQLWACPTAPASCAELTGQLVAHAALPPIGEIADEVHSFEVSTLAYPPAGQNEHVMVLALVAGNGSQFGEIHDLYIYERREQFLPPRLSGAVSYRIDGDRVEILAQRIENPRSADNLSGTLALELWALTTRYQGGAFQGVPLAGAAFDALAGQMAYHPRSFYLPFTAPPAGTWNLALMLREWTPAGFTTRDFVNFDQPYIQAVPVAAAILPAIVVPTAKVKTPAKRRFAAPAPQPVTPTSVKRASAKQPAKIKALVAPVAAPMKSKAPAKDSVAAKAEETPGKTSVNDATVKELTAVKGLSERLARTIVGNRPFASLDALADVKGMGAKLLAKLRPSLKL